MVLICFLSCEKVTYYEDKPILYTATASLAHRGGGTATMRDNNYASCLQALPRAEGIEVDVQLSKDRTVWLSHSSTVQGCSGAMKCFAETGDDVIESIDSCNGQEIKYTKLADVMAYMDQNNIRKYISIDMKGWAPCSGNSVDIEGEMRAEVEEIIKLGEQYHLAEYLLFENELTSVLQWAKKKNNSVKTFITSYGDYEKGMLNALNGKLDGITFKSDFKDELDIDKINLLHKKGLLFMVWNIADSSHIPFLESIHVDFIQIDL